MKREVGLWIDHRKAVVMTIEDGIEETQEIQSDLVKRVRFSGKTQSKDSVQPVASTAEDIRDRQFDNHLDNFYDGIIAMINTADSIWIFGPGEAKGELERRIQHAGLGDRVVGVETVDKMTNNQIEAKIRDHYLK
jgi:hypothetical protein